MIELPIKDQGPVYLVSWAQAKRVAMLVSQIIKRCFVPRFKRDGRNNMTVSAVRVRVQGPDEVCATVTVDTEGGVSNVSLSREMRMANTLDNTPDGDADPAWEMASALPETRPIRARVAQRHKGIGRSSDLRAAGAIARRGLKSKTS